MFSRAMPMRPAKPISQEEIEALEVRAPRIKGRKEYRRLQSVLLRAKENKSPEEIGKILGIHPRTVQKHQQRYFQQGLRAFESGVPGPKGPRLLKKEEEAALFESLQEEAATGQLLNATKIKIRFEEEAGKTCARSTIYLAIHRNQWSKKQPRPRHPKGDEEAKTTFKKNR
jgi:transposase